MGSQIGYGLNTLDCAIKRLMTTTPTVV